MALTSIGDQKTPGRPIEITFGADLGLPSANQEVLLIGHRAATGSSGTVASYTVKTMNNVADETAAQSEAEGYFGVGSELSKMVLAAVKANAGGGTFPALKCVALASADAGFGTADAALTAVKAVKAEFVVSPYDGDNTTLGDKLETACELMSGAQRVHNNQFGTVGVVANQDQSDPSALPAYDSQFISGMYLRDSAATPTYSLGELAAACAAKIAAGAVPFNPVDGLVIGSVPAPALLSDYLSVGAGLESETALNKGWTPLKVKANGDVAFVRSVTQRTTTDGITAVTSYYDIQDFQVLYFWRKTVFTRLTQPDLTNVKASAETARDIKAELIRLAQAFQDQGMFQAVDLLAKQFQVERSASDRHRFDVKTPVNVIPGLHVVAVNVKATTEFDIVSI